MGDLDALLGLRLGRLPGGGGDLPPDDLETASFADQWSTRGGRPRGFEFTVASVAVVAFEMVSFVLATRGLRPPAPPWRRLAEARTRARHAQPDSQRPRLGPTRTI